MTAPQFSRPGAIDLSALRRPPPSASTAGSGPAGAAGSYSFDVTSEDALRRDVVERSMSVVVLVSFWSAEAPGSDEINATLTKIADESGGRFLFARVDVGSQPALAEALRIPQVPLVVAALRGQLAPLIQDPLPEAEMRALVDQILEAAASNGVTGSAEPVGPAPDPDAAAELDSEPEEAPARFPEAEQALLGGDLAAAVTGYQEALRAHPGDPEAELGLAQAQLLRRTQGIDATGARAAAAERPDDLAAQTLAADLDLMGGHVDDAFGRLIDVVRRTVGDDRDTARAHLISMFGVVGDADPRVATARRQLANALF